MDAEQLREALKAEGLTDMPGHKISDARLTRLAARLSRLDAGGGGWQPIETLPDSFKIGDHALFWGRLYVSGSWDEKDQQRQKWVTDFKLLKWAYVGKNHGRGVGGSSNLENWHEPQSTSFATVDKLEATHWRPLPDPPEALSSSVED